MGASAEDRVSRTEMITMNDFYANIGEEVQVNHYRP